MAYCLRRKDRSLKAALRRIGREQVDKALCALKEDADPSRTVHEIRKRCKNIRGLQRLFHPGFEQYKRENACFRDLAKRLSGLRDAKVMLDTFDLLVAEADGVSGHHGLGAIRRRLNADRDALRDEIDVRRILTRSGEELTDARERIRHWEVAVDGWGVIGPAVTETYERARQAAEGAFAKQTSTSLHELRKRVRYHWCHARLLRAIWPEEMNLWAKLSWRLAGDLGDRHDLTVFQAQIEQDPGVFGSKREVESILMLARRRAAWLEGRSRTLAGRMFVETGDAFADRWHGLWKVWRDRTVDTLD